MAPIFKSEQYFWCHEDNNKVQQWLAGDHYSRLYAIYINDANKFCNRRRNKKMITHDDHMLEFLTKYPLTHTDIIEEFIWYEANVVAGDSKIGPHMTGLIDATTIAANDSQALAQARDDLYRQVFSFYDRRSHWEWRYDCGLLNPDEIEPIPKQHRRLVRGEEYRAKKDAARELKEREFAEFSRQNPLRDEDMDPFFWEEEFGVDSPEYAARLLLDLKVKQKKTQAEAEAEGDVEMEG